MKRKGILVALIVFSFYLSSEVKNPDKPLKGDWDFKLKKVWEVRAAGKNVFARVDGIVTANNGALIVFDSKKGINHIFSNEGKYITSFGPRGEGPGEIRDQEHSFFVNDRIVIPDINKIHYFATDGSHIKSVVIKGRRHRPSFFLNENEFVTATVIPQDAPDGIGDISIIDVGSGKRTIIKKFSIFKGGTAGKGAHEIHLVVNALTPMMIFGYDHNSSPRSKRFYYGMSDTYMINVANISGKVLDSFSLDRKKRKISTEAKKVRFKRLYQSEPADVVDKLIKSLPDEATYFNRIEIIDGLIYVFEPYLEYYTRHQQVDIFSQEGKYLFRAFIKPGENLNIIFSHFNNFVIKNGHLYIVLEDEYKEGEILIAKYKIVLPEL